MRRMSLLGFVCAAVLSLGFLGGTACGGGDDDDDGSSGIPILVGTTIPTAVIPTPTAVICETVTPLPAPAGFPGDLAPAVPPDFVILAVETTPFLKVVGRVNPPPDFDVPPRGVVAASIIAEARPLQWRFNLHTETEAAEYDFVLPDGRTGLFSASSVRDCPGYVDLTFEAHWIVP